MPKAKQERLLLGIKKILYSATKFQNDALCKKQTKTPLGIVALPTSKFGIIVGMSQQTLGKIDYIVVCVNEFADALYHSQFFRKLIDPATGLYRESGEYLYASMHPQNRS